MEACEPEMEVSLPDEVAQAEPNGSSMTPPAMKPEPSPRGAAPRPPSAEAVGSSAPSPSVATEYPAPRKPPIKLQMMQRKDSTGSTGSAGRVSSGGQIHRTSSVLPDGANTKSQSISDSTKKSQTVKKYVLTGLPNDQLLAEIQLRLKRLSEKEDLTVDVVDDLEYCCECAKISDRDLRIMLVKKMHELGLIKLMQNVWEHNFPAFASNESTSAYNNMKFIMVVVWNTTDKLNETCQEIVDSGFYKDIYIKYLNSDALSPSSKKSVKKAYLTKGLMGIIHNMLQRVEAREPMREVNAVKILAKFRESANDLIQTKAEILLAYLIDEKQNAEFNSDDKTFAYLIKVLKDCLGADNKEHYSKRYGYEAREVVAALNKLSVSELNKEKIINNGALPLIVSMMKPESSADEQVHSCNCIWNLSFHQKAKEAVINESGCINALQELLTKGANNSVKRTAFGALWTLKVQPKRKESEIVAEKVLSSGDDLVDIKVKKAKAEVPELEDLDADSPHIFISYNWGSKPTMLKVRDHLKTLGYNVWMDVDDMSGSVLEAMALAVEKAAVVVVCLSQKYKESPNCRTEGEYAFKVRKPIVPLRLEPKYIADGWLGALVGNKLFFDISTEEKLKQNLNSFVRELGDRGMFRKKGGDPVLIVPTESHMDLSVPPKKPSQPCRPTLDTSCKAEKWNSQDVQDWLKKNDLQQYQECFQEFDGELLAEYKAMLINAPEFFFKTLKEDMHFSLPILLKFTRALKNLD